MADAEEAAELADHARLLNDRVLLEQANQKLSEARRRAIEARAQRLASVEADQPAKDTMREVEELLDSVFVGLDLAELEPFHRAMTAQAATESRPPSSDRLSLGDLTLNRLNLSAEEVLVTLESEDHRWDNSLAALTVLAGTPERYLVALSRDTTGMIAGCVRVISVAESVHMHLTPDPLDPSDLREGDLATVARSLRGLPPEARDAWHRIASLRSDQDPLRAVILDELGRH
jgi:hypothetical protein